MESIKNLKGIIFDYGGTIDSRGVHWSEVIWDGYSNSGVPVGKEAFRTAYVFAERELAKTRHILPHHNFLDLMRIKVRIELEELERMGELAPGASGLYTEPVARYCYNAARECVEEARPTLEKLEEKYPMVLVSNFYGNVEAVLKDFDLLKYFGKIIESAVVGVRKPDPQIFKLGVDALGFEPEEVLVIGDSLKKDILPARSLGCHTAWLKGKGWTAEEDATQDASEIKKLEEVVDVAL